MGSRDCFTTFPPAFERREDLQLKRRNKMLPIASIKIGELLDDTLAGSTCRRHGLR
jgi:hypothetical protein